MRPERANLVDEKSRQLILSLECNGKDETGFGLFGLVMTFRQNEFPGVTVSESGDALREVKRG